MTEQVGTVSENVQQETAETGDGEGFDFGSLPPTKMLTRKDIARRLHRHEKVVERLVAKGELPPPSLYMQKRALWQASAIQAHIQKRIQQAAEDRAKLARN